MSAEAALLTALGPAVFDAERAAGQRLHPEHYATVERLHSTWGGSAT